MLNKVIKLLVILILLVVLLMLVNELYIKVVAADAALEYIERMQIYLDGNLK